MRDATIARNYAEALFELTGRDGSHDAAVAAFEALASTLAEEPRIRAFLETPKIAAASKKDVVQRALADNAPAVFVDFVRVVIDQNRQGLLDLMEKEYRTLVDVAEGRLHVEVMLARPPSAEQESEIAAGLSRKLRKDVVPHVRVNPNILGGVVVRFGDRVMDGSVKRQLATLRRRMLEADLPRDAASQS